MDRRLLRTVAIMVVIAALGGILLANRADRVTRAGQAARAAAAEDSMRAAAANPDSLRLVAAAIAAYDADRRTRGFEPLTVRILSYTRDSTGVVVMLIPDRLVQGADATIRVGPSGAATILRP
ncbi:MAG TPA: hypothetical protein VD707_04070 [Gemmatimonadales bacterium]|jgi:hypothetical protein|nr:hypothetical protein [Gemmatimonadales bacterium]